MRGGSKAIWNFSKNSANLVAGPFPNHFFVLKTSKNAMKHMILSFKMKGDVISDHFLMLWFQKDSLDTVGFRTFRTFRGASKSPK